MQIRIATDEDWPTVYPFWRAVMDDGRTYAATPGVGSDEARDSWMEQPPGGATVVAVDDDGSVIGSAHMGPNRPARGSHVATASFVVDPDARGKGVGRALGEYVIEWARAAGYRGIQFNAVVEANHAAVHLWQALGWQIVGTVPEAFDHPDDGLVGLHVMYRSLP